jgi:hypothetical protein
MALVCFLKCFCPSAFPLTPCFTLSSFLIMLVRLHFTPHSRTSYSIPYLPSLFYSNHFPSFSSRLMSSYLHRFGHFALKYLLRINYETFQLP